MCYLRVIYPHEEGKRVGEKCPNCGLVTEGLAHSAVARECLSEWHRYKGPEEQSTRKRLHEYIKEVDNIIAEARSLVKETRNNREKELRRDSMALKWFIGFHALRD